MIQLAANEGGGSDAIMMPFDEPHGLTTMLYGLGLLEDEELFGGCGFIQHPVRKLLSLLLVVLELKDDPPAVLRESSDPMSIHSQQLL